MADLLSLSGVYRIEEDPQIPGSEEMTWPFEYKVEVTRDEEDKDLYNIANDVTSGGQYMENFIQIRDNKDGTYNLTYDEYGDGNYQSVDGIDEDILMNHLNHLVNMDVAVKVSELPAEEATETEEAEESEEKLEESDLSDKVLDYIDSTYDKAIAQNRAGMTEDNDSESDKAYICAHCGKKIVNGKGHAKDCWTQELEEDASKNEIDNLTKDIIGLMTDEELTQEDIFNKIAESEISDKISLKRALELANELANKQKELFESKREKPARKRKRA